MKRSLSAAVLLVAMLATAAHATVPSTLSYQGVLSDNLGNIQPDGLYNFVFKIYDVGSGGSALWTETDNNVQLTKGSFSVLLGNATPINLAFDKTYYLGISVNGQPELTPRVQLAASAYGLSLRLPFSGSDTSSGPLFSIQNTGAGPDVLADHWLQVGTASAAGFIGLVSPTDPDGIAYLYDYGGIAAAPAGGAIVTGYGGALDLMDPSGLATTTIEPDVDGAGGGFVMINGPGSLGHVMIDGNYLGTGSPYMRLTGSSAIIFNSSQTGDNAVQLPAGSIDAAEILDEPGIAQGHNNGSSVNLTTSGTDIVAVTITTPADGYIVVSADGQHAISGNGSAANYAHLYITETSGSAYDALHYFDSGWITASPSLTQRFAVGIHRTYFKSAGTYTFYFQGQATNPSSLSNYVFDATITATYYPTSYGSVTQLVSAADAGRFPHAEHVAVTPGADQGAEGYRVDLRDLELQVAQQKARLAETENRLLQAQIARQLQGSSAVRARIVAAKPKQGGH